MSYYTQICSSLLEKFFGVQAPYFPPSGKVFAKKACVLFALLAGAMAIERSRPKNIYTSSQEGRGCLKSCAEGVTNKVCCIYTESLLSTKQNFYEY